MTKEQINCAIAVGCRNPIRVGLMKRGLWYRPDANGYTSFESLAGRYTPEEAKQHESIHGEEDDVRIVQFKIPNYFGDLNAIHEAEKMIINDKSPRRSRWFTWLESYSDVAGLHASAPQRCEAFLRAIGKWKEAK